MPNKKKGDLPFEGVPHFPMVVNSLADQGVTARVNVMENGYAVKTGGQAIFYSTAKEAADAVADGICLTLEEFEQTQLGE